MLIMKLYSMGAHAVKFHINAMFFVASNVICHADFSNLSSLCSDSLILHIIHFVYVIYTCSLM